MPNTVRAPRTPIYQLGWLGDDSTDDGLSDINFNDIEPIATPVFDTSLSFPDTTDTPVNPDSGVQYGPASPYTPVNPNSGVVYGPPAPGQPGGVPASSSSVGTAITSAITNLFKPSTAPTTLAPGPAPRVATSPVAGLSSDLPILALFAIGAVVLVPLISGGGGGRRRRR
jgi:hypothetical protein